MMRALHNSLEISAMLEIVARREPARILEVAEGVRADYAAYRPMLAESGVMAFHDVCHPKLKGVTTFWAELPGSKLTLT